jgi:hypothetical protein
MNPGMPAAVVHRRSWCRKVRVREGTHRDADRLPDALLGVKDGRPADGTEPENEPRSVIANTDIFGSGSEDLEWSGKSRQRRENAAGPLLAGETVTHADSGFAPDLNPQLPAAAGCHSGIHCGLLGVETRERIVNVPPVAFGSDVVVRRRADVQGLADRAHANPDPLGFGELPAVYR